LTNFASCVGSGYCCKKVPCPFGEADETGGCRFLEPWKDDDLKVPRYRCGKYEEILRHPMSHISPAFGAGCSSPLFNTDRNRVLIALRSRGKVGEIS
jgi:hypothetical protein